MSDLVRNSLSYMKKNAREKNPLPGLLSLSKSLPFTLRDEVLSLWSLNRTCFFFKAVGTSFNAVGALGFGLAAVTKGPMFFVWVGLGVTGAVYGAGINIASDWVKNLQGQRFFRKVLEETKAKEEEETIWSRGPASFLQDFIKGPHPEWRVGSQFLKTLQADLTLFKMFLVNIGAIETLVKYSIGKDGWEGRLALRWISNTKRFYQGGGDGVLQVVTILAGLGFVVIDLALLVDEWRRMYYSPVAVLALEDGGDLPEEEEESDTS